MKAAQITLGILIGLGSVVGGMALFAGIGLIVCFAWKACLAVGILAICIGAGHSDK